jgi:hypothetical protein
MEEATTGVEAAKLKLARRAGRPGELLCGGNARSSPTFLEINSGCGRFVQDAKLNVDALFSKRSLA